MQSLKFIWVDLMSLHSCLVTARVALQAGRAFNTRLIYYDLGKVPVAYEYERLWEGHVVVFGATVQVPSFMTRVGFQVEQHFVFLWDSESERLTLGLLLPINKGKPCIGDLSCFLRIPYCDNLALFCEWRSLLRSSFGGGRREKDGDDYCTLNVYRFSKNFSSCDEIIK